MERVLNMTYASSLTDLCEINSSFDTGVLRIAYAGKNRNNSSISKAVFERCIKTMYNCPIVCNYDRETDTLGGHDIELVRGSNGDLKLVNITAPVGCIPESAKYWWDKVTEEDGTVHEYLFTEVLLWKRQEAYQKIKEDGITAHSMEITVKSGELHDGVFDIKDFEFTAFALIGVEPCFESSALEVFSKKDFKEQLNEMMRDLKESFNLVTPSSEVDDKHPQNYFTEGGEKVLEEKNKLIAENGAEETLEFSELEEQIEEFSEKTEELKEKLEEINAALRPEEFEEEAPEEFALTTNMVEEIARVLSEETVQREWGEYPRYFYADCDLEANEVYCWDVEDWLLYGFSFVVDGDAIKIDFESKKRKKYVIADFDEGEQSSPFAPVFAQVEQKLHENIEWEAKYQAASDTVASLSAEVESLRKFKADTEAAIDAQEREKIFSQFADLAGIEAFENLRENNSDFDLATLEEKCFAIRGKTGTAIKFAFENKAPKLKVEKTEMSNEPYGGLFVEYGARSK